MLDLVVLLLMMTTTQTNISSLNQAKRRLYLQNEGGKDRSWSVCATLDPRVYFEILDDISQHGTYWFLGPRENIDFIMLCKVISALLLVKLLELNVEIELTSNRWGISSPKRSKDIPRRIFVSNHEGNVVSPAPNLIFPFSTSDLLNHTSHRYQCPYAST